MKTLSVLVCLLFAAKAGFSQSIPGFSPSELPNQHALESRLIELGNPEKFKAHLRALTEEPHVAGSPENEKVMAYIMKVMNAAGFTSEAFPYDIYLPTGPGESKLELLTPNRIPLNFQESPVEEDPFSSHPKLKHGWNAWSGSGDVTAEVIYANYGRKEDFEKLDAMGISVKGKIVLARYGGNFRGYKAKYAEHYGAIGLLIFTDPADNGYVRGFTYPEGPYFNESTIQRGSLLTVPFMGDPLTPFEPSLPLDGKKKIKRLDPAQAELPNIPVLPIPYGSAKEIIALMKGQQVPQGWQGGLPFTYRIEGGSEFKVRLKVEQKRDFVRIHNIVGTLKGSEFPNEWIIIGSHYDAWGFGATDPNSGTAAILGLAEALGTLHKSGWRPKRSIKLAHWDAEEHGVIGSSEWVEQFTKELSANAVAYINLDAAVSGRNFGSSAAPSLKQLVLEATKVIPFPDSSKTVYQVWQRGKTEADPAVGNLGGGSDHIGFYMHVGVPSLSTGVSGITPYHSNYDSFYYYEKFVDPSFKMGMMIEQVVGVMALRLANASVIPYQVHRYATDLNTHFSAAEKGVKALKPDFEHFQKARTALEKLKIVSKSWDERVATALEKGTIPAAKLRKINQGLIQLERSFIDTKGMYYGPWYRSLYASSDPYSGYASWMLPGIQFEIGEKRTDRLDEWDTRYATALTQLGSKIEQLLIELQ